MPSTGGCNTSPTAPACLRKVTFGLTTPSATQSAPGSPRARKAARRRAASRSRYALDPAVIAAGKLPDKAPVVTSAANPHYQKRFDQLHKLAATRDWAAVHD